MREFNPLSIYSKWLSILLTAAILFMSYSRVYGTTRYCSDIFINTKRSVSIPGPNQKFIIYEMKKGSVVQFSDGVVYSVKSVITKQNSDGIFDIGYDRVLRLSRAFNGETINQYLDGYEPLVKAGIPVPKILSAKRGERIVVEKLNIIFHLYDLFAKGRNISENDLKKLEDEFMEFVKKFKAFDRVADLHAGQIVYVKDRGWMLIDWRSDHRFGATVNPFYPVWESLDSILELNKKTMDLDLARSWRLASDRVIAKSRNQDPETYYNMPRDVHWRAVYGPQ